VFAFQVGQAEQLVFLIHYMMLDAILKVITGVTGLREPRS
jgi:hypothetical protein